MLVFIVFAIGLLVLAAAAMGIGTAVLSRVAPSQKESLNTTSSIIYMVLLVVFIAIVVAVILVIRWFPDLCLGPCPGGI